MQQGNIVEIDPESSHSVINDAVLRCACLLNVNGSEVRCRTGVCVQTLSAYFCCTIGISSSSLLFVRRDKVEIYRKLVNNVVSKCFRKVEEFGAKRDDVIR